MSPIEHHTEPVSSTSSPPEGKLLFAKSENLQTLGADLRDSVENDFIALLLAFAALQAEVLKCFTQRKEVLKSI